MLRSYQIISPGPRHLCMPVIIPVFTVRSCQHLAKTPSWRTTPCRLSVTDYWYIRSYPPYWRPFLHPQPDNAPCNGARDHFPSSLLSKNIKMKIYRTIILPVVLYGCETWSLTLREERRRRVLENRVLRRIFGPKRDESTGEWRKLHNEELNFACCFVWVWNMVAHVEEGT